MLTCLPRNLAALADVTGRGRFAADAIRVGDSGTGLYRAEAANGKVVAIVQGAVADASYPNLDPPAGEASETLVSGDDWRRAFRLGDRTRPAGLAAGPDSLALAVGDQTLATRPLAERFPDVDSVLPKQGPLVAVRLDPSLLIPLLKAAAALGPENGVELLYYGRGKPLGLRARNAGGQAFDGLLMPLT
jgi:hypothetical protein